MAPPKKHTGKCSVETCDKDAKSDGLCMSCYGKRYRQQNKAAVAEQRKQYREKNADTIKEKKALYYENNKDVILEKDAQYYKNNRERKLAYQKDYAQKNAEAIAAYKKSSYNPEEKKEYNNKYRKENRTTILAQQSEYRKANVEPLKQKSKRWREEDPERFKESLSRSYYKHHDKRAEERKAKREKELEDYIAIHGVDWRVDDRREDYYVYRWTNTLNGLQYVGKGRLYRAYAHTRDAKKCVGGKLSRAMSEFGVENFTLEYLARDLTNVEAYQKEAEFIKLFDTVAPLGYNTKRETGRAPVRTPTKLDPAP